MELARIQAGRQTYDFDTYVRPRVDDPATEEVESGLETITVDPRDKADMDRATEAGYKEISVYRAEMGAIKHLNP